MLRLYHFVSQYPAPDSKRHTAAVKVAMTDWRSNLLCTSIEAIKAANSRKRKPTPSPSRPSASNSSPSSRARRHSALETINGMTPITAGNRQDGLRGGIKAQRRAGACRYRMRTDCHHQRVERQHPADTHRKVEVAILQEFQIGDKPFVRGIATHRLKCPQPGARRPFSHHAALGQRQSKISSKNDFLRFLWP